jgi:hypothetical protein
MGASRLLAGTIAQVPELLGASRPGPFRAA